jgi:hypothetical protein
MKKKIAAAVAFATMMALTVGAPAFGHAASPCNDSGEPGNSDYAQHHIVPLAQAGALGDGGHKPGFHKGFAACDPSGD